MKRVLATVTAIMLSSSVVMADAKSDKQAFREAYKAFKVAMSEGDRGTALEHGKLAYEYGEKIYGPDHKNTATLLLNYGRLVWRDDEAEKLLEDAVSRYEKLYGEDAEKLIDPLIELAARSAGIGTLGVSRKHYRRALKLAEKYYPDDAFIKGQILLEMGKVALQESGSRDALEYLMEAQELLKHVEGPAAEENLAQANFQIGKYKMVEKEYAEAEAALLSSLGVFEEIAPDSRMTMTNHAFLIRVYEEQGMRENATKHCKAIGSKTPVNPDQNYMPIYRAAPTYPTAARKMGKEGYAIVELTVDKNGFVKDPVVVESRGHNGFLTASLDAAKLHRYAPRFENGQAVETKGVRYKFSYNLR